METTAVLSDAQFQCWIGSRVRELRHAKGLSQESFADACGLHRTHVSLLERGKINVTVSTLQRIAQTLEVRLEKFFKTQP
jgi:transcriptional regulator with XRE-family HTH domain